MKPKRDTQGGEEGGGGRGKGTGEKRGERWRGSILTLLRGANKKRLFVSR